MRPDLPAKHTPLARTDARIGLLFVLPALALFLVFRFGPALAGLAPTTALATVASVCAAAMTEAAISFALIGR